VTRRSGLRLLLLAALVAGIALAAVYRGRLDAGALQAWTAAAGAWGPLVFMAGYALATVLFVPGSLLTLAGGALFGPLWGTLYNLTGATLGATLAFLVARYLAGDWVAARTGRRLTALREGIEKEGWRFVAFTRLVPLFPFNLLNYALGLTRIPLGQYVLATYVCMLPGALAYTYLGYAGREAVAGGEALIQKGLLALGLLALVAFLPRIVAHFRRGPTLAPEQLRARLEAGEDILVLDVRSAKEFGGELGHIPGARNLPVEELARRLDELADRMERPIAIVCRTEKRSHQAARLLARHGFADVHVVAGGMVQWQAMGAPVER